MSRQAAIEFLKKVAEDPGLQEKLVQFAKQQGYEFSVDELSEGELGGITGGALNAYVKLDQSLSLGGINTSLISPTLSPLYEKI